MYASMYIMVTGRGFWTHIYTINEFSLLKKSCITLCYMIMIANFLSSLRTLIQRTGKVFWLLQLPDNSEQSKSWYWTLPQQATHVVLITTEENCHPFIVSLYSKLKETNLWSILQIFFWEVYRVKNLQYYTDARIWFLVVRITHVTAERNRILYVRLGLQDNT